jgi:uncharacterized protein
MTTLHSLAPAASDLSAAIRAALVRIPPLWPLRHFVAVNPFVGLVDRPFSTASELLQRVAGAAPLQRASSYLEAYQAGRIEPADLLAAADADWTPAALIEALMEPGSDRKTATICTVADLLAGPRKAPGALELFCRR